MRPYRRLVLAAFVALNSVTRLSAGFDLDNDDDGFTEQVDCDDHDDRIWAVPGQPLQLRFTSKTTMVWDPVSDAGGTSASVRYDTLRSTSASNFSSAPPGVCADPEGSTASSDDAAVPPSGTMFFYVVRAKNNCGDGTLGDGPGGVPRAGMACDCSTLCSDGLTCTRDHCVDGACAHDPIPPTIESPPQSVAICAGGEAHFSVRASGQGALHYQWKKNGVNVGGDSSTAILIGAEDGAEMGCTVTDNCASATSAVAVLTVFSTAASCSGGGTGPEAPNGASTALTDDPDRHLRDKVEASETGSVYLFSGEYYLETADLVIRGRGFDFEWTRKYRSRESRLTSLGHNWDFSYNRFVMRDLPGTDLIVADGNSRRDRYVLGPTGCWTAPGFFRELCSQPDGALVLTFPGWTTWTFHPLDGGPAQGRIVEIRDSNQNTMTFAYDPGGRLATVTDTLGRNVAIAYNANGQISTVTDFAGRRIGYSYYGSLEVGGTPGDLKSVTSPVVTGTPTGNDFPLGKTTTFTYTQDSPNPALDHNLLTITDPMGQVVLRNTYTTSLTPADPRFDRIDRQTFPNGTIGYAYIAQSPGPGSDAVTKTIVNDRAGNVGEVFSNALNQVVMTREYTGRAPDPAVPTDDVQNRPIARLRPTDPAYFETRTTWSADSLPTSVVLPEGNSIQSTYDSGNVDVRLRANLLQRVSSPGPRGADQPAIAESWTYATSFGSEPCVCRGCCGEGGGRRVEKKGGSDDKPTADRYIYYPFRFGAQGVWATHDDGRGLTWTQVVDPATGNVLQASAPSVTTGVLGGGSQTIAESWQYNAFGQVIRHVSPTGRADEYSYHASGPATGYLERVTIDAPGPIPGSHLALSTVTARDAFGNATAITDPNGNTETLVYNQLDQLVRRIAKPPFGYHTDTCYDANDRMVATHVQNVDENGVIRPNAAISTVARYDARGHRVRETIDADTVNIRREFEYDANDHVTLERLPEAVNGHQSTNVVRTLFDERGLRYRTIEAEGDAAAGTSQWDYDGNGNVVAVREGLAATPAVTTLAYDGYDRQIASTDAMGNVSSSHYDANGNVMSRSMHGELIDGESGPNVLLSATATTYDEVNRSVQQDVAHFDTVSSAPIGDGVSTTKTYYNEASQILRVEDDNGHGTDTTYDGANRIASIQDAKGNTTTYGYDANGNVLSLTELELSDLPTPPESFVTSSTFDALDRLTSTTSNAGQVRTYRWDSRGNLTIEIDAKGNEIRSDYDAVGRLTATHRTMTETGNGGGAVSYVLDGTRSYDDNSRLLQQADDGGNATAYQYDARGRLVATLHPDGTSEHQSYDVHGNLVNRVDPNGSVTTATFDANQRLTTRSIVRAAGVLGATTETWKYDGRSRIVHAANDGATVTRAYDSLSNITEETLEIGASPARALHGAHDGEGNRISTTYPSGLTVATTFDPLDRPKTIATGGPRTCSGGAHDGVLCVTDSDCLPGGSCTSLSPRTTSYDYAGTGRVVRRSNGNGTQGTFTYDAARRMTRSTYVKLFPYADIDDRAFSWDAMDNKISRAEVVLFGGGTVHQYSYDSAGQMTEAIWMPPGLPAVATSYACDGTANRLAVTGGTDAGPYIMSGALPEPADQQTNQYTATPFDARLYDRNGNLVEKPSSGESMKYDYRNQLVEASGPLGSVTYAYDPFGRRIAAGGKEYVFDGLREIEERDAGGTLRAAYVRGLGLDEIAIALADVNGDSRLDRSHPVTDDLGNVVAMTDDTGFVLERYDYGDFGTPRFMTPSGSSIPQSAIGNAMLFNGRKYDSTTELYDYRTRDLDPRAGRFTSRDSIGTWGDEGNFGNGSAYVGNNPWSAVDPTGTHRWLFCNSRGQSYIYTGSTPSLAASGGVPAGGCAFGPWALQLEGILQLGGGGPGATGMGSAAGVARGPSGLTGSPSAARLPGGGGGVGGGGEVMGKWECIWSGGTWIYDWSMGGFCMKPLRSMQTVAGGPGTDSGSGSAGTSRVETQSLSSGTGSMAKLCPGHISCPPTRE